MTEFASRRVLVTGASRGVGAATAKAFARAGAHTVILAARNGAALDRVKTEIETMGGRAEAYPVDLSSREACRELAARCGDIDVLINNAAFTSGADQNVLVRNDEFWDMNFAVTFFAPLILMQELGRGMAKRGRGVVLNISSMAAQRPVPEYAPYGVSKAALDTLSKAAGMELAGLGVRVNSVALGHVDTEALRENCGEGLTPDDVARINSPLGRAIKATEIADFCVYLASDAAAPIVGTVLTIDGGLTAGSFSFSKTFGEQTSRS
ncbi:MAG: SDR family oxidoreductase [Porticoccaceae bacterium]